MEILSILPRKIDQKIDRFQYLKFKLRKNNNLEFLEATFKKHLAPYVIPLPIKPEEMKRINAQKDQAPVYWHTHTLAFHKGADEKSQYASQTLQNMPKTKGIFEQLDSPEFKKLIRQMLPRNIRLVEHENDFFQLSRYEQGDSLATHCDYYGTAKRPNYTIELHFTFSRDVVHHYLVMQGPDGRMSNMVNIGEHNYLGVYILPMWHQMTPLQCSRPGGFRWLMITSYPIAIR